MNRMDQYYWDRKIEEARNEEEFRSAMDGLLSYMVDSNMVSMSWDDEIEDFVFFMTAEQKQNHDRSHA